MATRKLTIRDANGKARILQEIEAREDYPFRVAIADGEETRSQAQNALIHKWFGEIAAQKGDETALDIKTDCNIAYGVPIMSRDNEDWRDVFAWIFRGLDIERKRKAVRVMDVPFTRNMTVKQLNEYMDQMSRDYRSQGFILTDPEAQKYESENK